MKAVSHLRLSFGGFQLIDLRPHQRRAGSRSSYSLVENSTALQDCAKPASPLTIFKTSVTDWTGRQLRYDGACPKPLRKFH